MPKMKSNKGASKSFRKTASGKIKRKKAYTSHILTSKTTKRKRNLRHATLVSSSEEKRVKTMIQ
ncbi:MAG: 50S ribosomal protein L35 [Bacteroidetes bacterium]|nr:50S ribosomal protein L35 [Bacteroidota bacterium]